MSVSVRLVLPLVCGTLLAACGGGGGDSAAPAATQASTGSSASNKAPTIGGTPPLSVVQGQAYDFRPAAQDVDGDALDFYIVNRPPWAAFDAATGRLHGTPAASDLGRSPDIEIGATDGKARVSLPLFAIMVSAVGGPAGAVLIGWTPPLQNTDSSSLTDLAGYRVYWGPDPEQLSDSVTIRTAGVTSHMVEPLQPGRYYFAVTAFNEQNVESERSEPVAAVVR